eukprot:1940443-Pyramimonas_sp.AAC.1
MAHLTDRMPLTPRGFCRHAGPSHDARAFEDEADMLQAEGRWLSRFVCAQIDACRDAPKPCLPLSPAVAACR